MGDEENKEPGAGESFFVSTGSCSVLPFAPTDVKLNSSKAVLDWHEDVKELPLTFTMDLVLEHMYIAMEQ